MGKQRDKHRYWLSVIGDVEGLRWVLLHGRMAWTPASNRRATSLAPGDPLILYVSRNAFHNPTRDESQLVAVATILTATKQLKQPITLAERKFIATTDVQLDFRLPEREGVAVKPLVPRLSFVRRPEVWGMYFRSGLIEISGDDFLVLKEAISESHSRYLSHKVPGD